jgi:YidC/Oxa1 family membrane protein insertase
VTRSIKITNAFKNSSNLQLGSLLTTYGTQQLVQTRQMSIFNFFSSPPPQPPKTPISPADGDSTTNSSDPTINSNSEIVGESTISDPTEMMVESASESTMEVFSDLAADALTEVTAAVIPAGSWNPKYQVMHLISYATGYLGVPYWEAIVIVTLGVRILMLPLAIKTVVGSSRLAVVRPKMQKLQDMMNKDPMSQSNEAKARLQADMMALFKKHKVNPFMTILWPFFQLPVFMAFFFALQDISTYFPAYNLGGAYWFVNLQVADPTMLLPILNCLGFLAIAQIGR